MPAFSGFVSRAFRVGGRNKNNVPSRKEMPTAYGDRESCVKKGNTNCVSMGETSVLSNWEE